MVNFVVFWARIQNIYAVMYEVDAVYAVVTLLHNRQKELDMKKKVLRETNLKLKFMRLTCALTSFTLFGSTCSISHCKMARA